MGCGSCLKSGWVLVVSFGLDAGWSTTEAGRGAFEVLRRVPALEQRGTPVGYGPERPAIPNVMRLWPHGYIGEDSVPRRAVSLKK